MESSTGLRRAAPLLRGSVSLLLLALLAGTVEPARLLSLAGGVDLALLGLSLAASLLQVPAISFRAGLLLRSRGWRIPPGDLLRLTFVSNFLGSFLPSGVGGDLVRAGSLAGTRLPASTAVAVVAADRLCGALGLALAALLAGLSAWVRQGSSRELALAFLPAGAVLLLAALAWSRSAWRAALVAYRRLPRLPGRRLLRRVHHQVSIFGRQPRALAQAVGLALVVQVLRVASFWACAAALALPLGPLRCAEALLPAMLVSMVPVSVAGLGVREGLLVLLLPFPPAEALGLALVHRLVTSAANLPGAWWFGGRGLAVEALRLE